MRLFRRRATVSSNDVKVSLEKALSSATAMAKPEDRNALMNIRVLSRDPQESDGEWLSRTIEAIKQQRGDDS